jgi:hypothetical protein
VNGFPSSDAVAVDRAHALGDRVER